MGLLTTDTKSMPPHPALHQRLLRIRTREKSKRKVKGDLFSNNNNNFLPLPCTINYAYFFSEWNPCYFLSPRGEGSEANPNPNPNPVAIASDTGSGECVLYAFVRVCVRVYVYAGEGGLSAVFHLRGETLPEPAVETH